MNGLTRRRRFASLLAGLAMAAAAGGSACAAAEPAVPPPEVKAALPDARLQGSGGLRYFFMHIYDARLWCSKQAVGPDWAALPFALELTYDHDLVGKEIAQRSIEEMRRQGALDPDSASRWQQALTALIPDVKPGDRITGVNLPGVGARFFYNGALRGELRDALFTRLFFGIWLSPRTSEPALRTALLGTAGP
jgi:hypothetical protein